MASAVIDEIELVGCRPKTLVVVRYHHRPEVVGRATGLVAGPLAEVAELWDFAIEEEYNAHRILDGPAILAAAIGCAFEAAELTLVDPKTLEPIGAPPKVYPRLGRHPA